MRIARIIDQSGATVYAAEQNGKLLRLEGAPLAGPMKVTGAEVRAQRWLPPIEPRVIYCIGANYQRHAEESGIKPPKDPILFIKNLSAAIGHGEAIRLPKVCGEEVDYECELVVVIGRACRDVTEEAALDYVLGYTAGNDVSARLWQKDRCGGQWVRGKGFDTFAPLGPVLVTRDEIPDPNNLSLKTTLNGRVMQDSHTSDMIFSVRRLVSFISQDTTLLPGTIIMTGTPEGVGWARNPKVTLKPGDEVSIEIEKIGTLTNPVQ